MANATGAQLKLQQAVKLKPGETVHYDPTRAKGQRYYAAPAAPKPAYAPKPPAYPVGMAPAPPATIEARATAQANAALLPQQQAIQENQRQALALAAAQEEEIQGASQGAATLEGQIAPAVSNAYNSAAGVVGQLGQGMATGVQDTLAAANAQDQAIAAAQGHGLNLSTDPAAAHDVLYGLGGSIPGTALAQEGAARSAEAAQVPQIQLNAGINQIQARMAQARSDQDGFAQQLLDVAAQYPGQRAQALQALNQYEVDKANYREAVRNNKAQTATANRSLADQEKAAGLDATAKTAATNAEYAYKYAALQLKSNEDIAKIKASGKIIDAAASKAVGWVVYKDGSFNKAIKVRQSGGANPATAAKTRAGYITKATAAATKALSGYTKGGKPVANPNTGVIGKGSFMAAPKYANIAPGKPGATYHTLWGTAGYPARGPRPAGDVATTDRAGRAVTQGGGGINKAQATARLEAAVAGYLQAAGYNQHQIDAWVAQQVNAYYPGG